MVAATTALSIGIEEEFLLTDRRTGALVAEPDPGFMRACHDVLHDRVSPELCQAEVEIATRACGTIEEARAELVHLRGTLAGIAARFGMALLACSTHPFSHWRHQKTTTVDRYLAMREEYQAVAQRNVVCGMHIHVGVPDVNERLVLMERLIPFLPLMLALTTSSPFWCGLPTGLKAFRPAIFSEFPRTGIPDGFASWADWQDFLAILADTGLCPDSTQIWWDIRPSAKQPTVEMRVFDVCTRLGDTLAVAAFVQSLCARLRRGPLVDAGWRRYRGALVRENKWRAQRWGVEARLGDFDRRRPAPVALLVDQLIETLAPDAASLGCAADLARVRRIVAEGTSADAQLAIHRACLERGGSVEEAHQAVVAWIARTTTDHGDSPGPTPIQG